MKNAILLFVISILTCAAKAQDHKLERFCYTRQGYPRFCVATSYNGVGMGVNFK